MYLTNRYQINKPLRGGNFLLKSVLQLGTICIQKSPKTITLRQLSFWIPYMVLIDPRKCTSVAHDIQLAAYILSSSLC